MAKKKLVRVVTPAGVAAFTYIDKPDEGKKYSDGKYKAVLPLDNDDPYFKELRKKAHEAAKAEWDKKAPKAADLKLSFSDGTDMANNAAEDGKYEEFRDKTLINAKSKYKPKLVDAKRNPLPKGVTVKAGDLVKLNLALYPYTQEDKVKVKEKGKTKTITETVYGISFQLRAIQLLEKRTGGPGEDDFEVEEEYEGFDAEEYNENGVEDDGEGDDDIEDF